MAENYYKTLGVANTATTEEIQKAYRKLARKYHPDLHADADEKEKKKAKENFQKIQQAYDVLSEPDKREMYDQFGDRYEQMAGGGGSPYGNYGPMPGGAGGAGGFEDIFRQMGGMEGAPRSGGGRGFSFEDILRQMGGGRGGPRGAAPPMPDKGEDIEQEITVSFAVSVLGGTHQVSLRRPTGKIESIDVKIPAGIDSGQKIRLRGQGYPHPAGGTAGNLNVIVKVAPHPQYTRSGLNLNVTIPISLLEAAQGAKIELPTPHGKVSLSVPKGSSSGKSLRLRGMGIRTKDRSGDLIATLQIVTPQEVSEADLKLLKQLSSQWQAADRTELKW